MTKGPNPRERLAQHMDDRRIDLGLRWADVAELAGLTPEGLRGVRRGDGELRGLTRRGIEDALRWSRGSIQSILTGGGPQAISDETVPATAGPIMDVSDIQLTRVREAIEADPSLLEEAKFHLLNQYELLRRLSPEPSDRPGTDGERRAMTSPERPLQAVADQGDPSHRAEMERRAREVRKRHPRKSTETGKDDRG